MAPPFDPSQAQQQPPDTPQSQKPIDYAALAKQAGAVYSKSANSTLQPGQRDEDYLNLIQSKDPGTAGTIKALADGRMAFPAGFALKSPYWQGMLNAVSQYDPSFDAVNYNARSQARTKFTSGKEGQMVNNLNTAIGHLQELDQATEALHNSNYPWWNWLANNVDTLRGKNEVTNFDAVAHRVVPELVGAYRAGGGTESDIQTGLKDFSHDASPDQNHGALQETAKLLESKVRALQDQYNQGMGTTENGLTLLRPDARAALDRLQGKQGSQSTAQSSAFKIPPGAPAAPSEDGHVLNWNGKPYAQSKGGQWMPLQTSGQ